MNRSVLIDIEEVVRKRTNGRHVPRFIISFLKKLVHQDDFNAYFCKGVLGYDFCFGFLDYIDVKVEVIGEENIPAEGRFTFASNHPLGGVDACFETGFLARKFNGQLAIPANDFMMTVKQVDDYLIPVNLMGRQDKGLRNLLNEAFESDKQVMFFPAGACSRRINGEITDLPWKKTFLTKSVESHRDIIPVWFSGQNSNRFYRLSDFCKRFRIKAPLAMFTLPDELFRCRGKRYKMVIGKPIPWQTFTPDKSDSEWTSYVRKAVYDLRQD